MTMTTATATRDVVFTFSFETYSDAVHRGMNRPPDRLLQTVLQSEQLNRVLVANPFRSAPVRLARRIARVGDLPFPTTDRHSVYTPLRLGRREPGDTTALRSVYKRWDEAVGRAARRRGLVDPMVITAHPLVAGFCDFAWASGVTYYARDDWAELPERAPWHGAILDAYSDIARRGRAVAAVSQRIIDRVAPTGPSVVVPNGVRADEWLGQKPAEPTWLSAIPHPRALYVGTLDTRLDVEGIRSLALSRPDLHIVLLGALREPEHVAPIRSIVNVHVAAAVDRVGLVAAMRNVDICLLSHVRSPLTEAMSPLKVYEYLAAGKPTISVDLPPVRGISSRQLVAPSVADFAELVPQALAMGDVAEAERRIFIGQNSWESRHRVILDLALDAAR